MINFAKTAKTEVRGAFNTGDPERLIALLDPAFVYMADGLGLAIGASAPDARIADATLLEWSLSNVKNPAGGARLLCRAAQSSYQGKHAAQCCVHWRFVDQVLILGLALPHTTTIANGSAVAINPKRD